MLARLRAVAEAVVDRAQAEGALQPLGARAHGLEHVQRSLEIAGDEAPIGLGQGRVEAARRRRTRGG
jgi:hypothetical protein